MIQTDVELQFGRVFCKKSTMLHTFFTYKKNESKPLKISLKVHIFPTNIIFVFRQIVYLSELVESSSAKMLLLTEIISLFFLGKPDPPKDVRINVIGNIANITWIIPTNQGVRWSRIYLNDLKKKGHVDLNSGKGTTYKDIPFHISSFEIANIKMCSEYSVRIQCISGSQLSEYTTQKFWMTRKILFFNYFILDCCCPLTI